MSGACCSPSSDRADDDDGIGAQGDTAGNNRRMPAWTVVDGGAFAMGSDHRLAQVFPSDGEGPARIVQVSGFRISPTTVTNAEWRVFAEATGYQTHAERYGWSFVFAGLLSENPLLQTRAVADAPWWRQVHGAYWQCPEGPWSSVEDRLDHPVVHVSWRDAGAYADWIGGRLPTEAEWECAALGGMEQGIWPWGDEFHLHDRIRANIFEGTFPGHNTCADGYAGTAPVTAYEPNGYGLFNCVGNVWEWCADWFTSRHSDAPVTDPVGPETGPGRVTKGGSYLCHDSYCNRYRISSRTYNTPTSSTGHTGFRLAADV